MSETMSFEEALKAEYSEPSTEIKAPEPPPIQQLPPDDTSPQGSADSPGDADTDPDAPFGRFQDGRPSKRRPKGSGKQPLVAFEEKEGDSVLGGELITGSMFLAMIDLVLPGLIVIINNMAVSNPKYRMNLSDMQLDKETHDRLQPLANATLRRVKLRGNPLVWLSITLMATYSFKYAQVQFDRKYAEAMEAKEKQKEK